MTYFLGLVWCKGKENVGQCPRWAVNRFLIKQSSVACRFLLLATVRVEVEEVEIQNLGDFPQGVGINPLVFENAIHVLP